MAIGRITGPLLKANLLRDGVNLAFETDLLFLDVVNGKVGIKTTPSAISDYDLGVNGTTRTTDLQVTNQADIATFTIVGDTISSNSETINLEPTGTNPVIYQAKIVTGDLQINSNVIETTASNLDLQINTVGTGRVVVGSILHNTDVLINGDLHATGSITADGDIQIGDSNTDSITFNADITSNIIPDITNTYDLGSDPQTGGQAWRAVYAETLYSTNVTINALTVSGDLTVNGDAFLNQDVALGTSSTDTVTIPGTISSNLVPTTTLFYDIGTDLLRWNNAFFSRVEIDRLVIDNNTIATTNANDDLVLTANGTGRVYIPDNNVQIDQQLTVNGDTFLAGTTINGNVTQTGDVTQTGNFTQTGDTDITGNLTVSSFAQFENIRIDNNTISTTVTDSDLVLDANGTGRVNIPNDDVIISQNLTVDATATIEDLSVTNTLTAGSFSTGDILINDNYITTQLTNSNLELKANGTGIINVTSNDVLLDQNLTVGQDLTVSSGTSYLKDVTVVGDITQTGDIHQTGDFTTSGTTQVTGNITGTGTLELSDITVSGHTIQVTTPDTDLALLPTGTGDVIFENIRVTDNTFKSTLTNQDIILEPQGVGSVLINSNQSLIIPVGTDAQRPSSPVNGMIRYNTDRSRYEGWNSTYGQWLQLSGVTDLDGNTYIKAEATVGANDNVLYFYADGNLVVTIDSDKLFTSKFQTSGINIENNTISSIATDTDINFTTAGTGGVKIGNLKIRNNTITNTVSGAITEFAETGGGFVRITGTNGVVLPVGDNTNQPSLPETGMIRYNTFYQFVEVFDGVSWVNAAGGTSGVSVQQATDIGISMVLMLG